MEKCLSCGVLLVSQVCKSAAGYYVGTWCSRCGPHSRLSGYYSSEEDAQFVLDGMIHNDN